MHVFLASSVIVRMELSGAELLAALEQGATDPVYAFLPPETREDDVRLIETADQLPGSNFLHQSGMRLTVDYTRRQGQRVTAALVRRATLQPNRTYTVAMDNFLAQGYSGYHWFRTGRNPREVGKTMDLLLDGLRCRARRGPVRGYLDGRLQLRGLRFAG
jgi:hypothetical protein